MEASGTRRFFCGEAMCKAEVILSSTFEETAWPRTCASCRRALYPEDRLPMSKRDHPGDLEPAILMVSENGGRLEPATTAWSVLDEALDRSAMLAPARPERDRDGDDLFRVEASTLFDDLMATPQPATQQSATPPTAKPKRGKVKKARGAKRSKGSKGSKAHGSKAHGSKATAQPSDATPEDQQRAIGAALLSELEDDRKRS